MATSRLLLSHLRRRSNPLSQLLSSSHISISTPLNTQTPTFTPHSLFHLTRFFSSRPEDFSDASPKTQTSELINELVNTSCNYQDSIFPIRGLVSSLDSYHDFTGLPWWVIIVSSTVAMRLSLLPFLVLQLRKLKTISELFPKLPPPFPEPFSGKSYVEQFRHFQKQKRELGCPSFLWFAAAFSVQVPCFFLWVTTIRRMSLNHHFGFDCGGTLWFQNLTEFPHGVLGPVFPLLMAGLHYLNVKLAFEKSVLQEMPGLLGVLARYYKIYLDILTLPLFFIGYNIPQGSLVYWVTNSSLSAIQQLSLKNPNIREKLGLPIENTSAVASNSQEVFAPDTAAADSQDERQKVPAEKLSPKQLVAISAQLLSSGNIEKATTLLKLALEKDPFKLTALILMGQSLMNQELYAEANKYFEQAIHKLLHPENPAEAKDYFGHLILLSQWAGVSCIRQGKDTEGILHLERVANLEEPDDSNSKLHYFQTLIYLASALLNTGRKAEAIKYMRLVVAHNPEYKEMLERFEKEPDDLISDLSNSRRSDY